MTSTPSASSATEGAGAATSAHAIRQQIFQRLQQLEENKAKYTERARHFLDRERASSNSPPAASSSPGDDAGSPTPTQLLASRLEKVTSEDTRAAIKAGLLQQEMSGVVSDSVRDDIKAGLVRTELQGAGVSDNTQQLMRNAFSDSGNRDTRDSYPAPDSLSSPGLSSPSESHGPSESHPNSPSHTPYKQTYQSPSASRNQSPMLAGAQGVDDSFDRIAQWANASPLRSPGQAGVNARTLGGNGFSAQQNPRDTTKTFDELDTNGDGGGSNETWGGA